MKGKLLAYWLVVVTTIMPISKGLERAESGLANLMEAEEDVIMMPNAYKLNDASDKPRYEKTQPEVEPRKLGFEGIEGGLANLMEADAMNGFKQDNPKTGSREEKLGVAVKEGALAKSSKAAEQIEKKRDAFMTRDDIEKALEQLKSGYEEERSAAKRAMENLRQENDKIKEALQAIIRRDTRNEMKRLIRSKNDVTRSELSADMEEMGEKFNKRQMKEEGVPTYLQELEKFVTDQYFKLERDEEKIGNLTIDVQFLQSNMTNVQSTIKTMKRNLAEGDESLAAKTDELRSKINNVESEQIRCETGWRYTYGQKLPGENYDAIVTFTRPFTSSPWFLLAISGLQIDIGNVKHFWYKNLSKTGVTITHKCVTHGFPGNLCGITDYVTWIACGH